jgi:hypothetical protein
MIVTCDECQKECRVVTIDVGIGVFEYWGFRGVDTQLHRVSDCCEATFTDHRTDQEDSCPF